MLIIKILIAVSIFFLLVRIHYSIKLQGRNKSRLSIFAKMFGGVYGGGVIFPILKKANNTEEKRLIQRANIAVSLFWILFLIAMLLVLFDI
jgi:hypothetical protein